MGGTPRSIPMECIVPDRRVRRWSMIGACTTWLSVVVRCVRLGELFCPWLLLSLLPPVDMPSLQDSPSDAHEFWALVLSFDVLRFVGGFVVLALPGRMCTTKMTAKVRFRAVFFGRSWWLSWPVVS